MWGNSLGWTISVMMVATVAAAISWLGRSLEAVSLPTDFSTTSGAADVITLPIDPSSVLPPGAGPVDPAGLYHQAMALYQENPSLFDAFAANAMKADPEEIEPAVDLLRQAAGTVPVPLFAATPAEVVMYNSEKPQLKALTTLGDCALNLGLRARQKKTENKVEAKQDFEAGLALGARLADERLCYAEFGDGLGLMSAAAIKLAEMAQEAGDNARENSLNAFSASIKDYSSRKIQPIEQVLSSVTQATLEEHAGDVFWLAQHAKERMWRVESILAVGRYRFNAGRKADNIGAARIATEIANSDSDPVIKTAAVLARDLTDEDYNLIH